MHKLKLLDTVVVVYALHGKYQEMHLREYIVPIHFIGKIKYLIRIFENLNEYRKLVNNMYKPDTEKESYSICLDVRIKYKSCTELPFI